MDGVVNNLHDVLKRMSKIDGNKADEFLERNSKPRVNLSIYNKTIFNIFQGQQRPPKTDDD